MKLMDYGRLRKEDLVIASGVVEGAARYVVGERLDNSGMRWIEERAEAVLLLRCIEVNGDWEAFMEWSQSSAARNLTRAGGSDPEQDAHSITRSRMNPCTRSQTVCTHRDRGEPRGSSPPTPPGIRVRTTAVRSG